MQIPFFRNPQSILNLVRGSCANTESSPNESVLILRYSDAKAGEDEMVEITKVTEYVITNVSLDRTVHSGFDEVKQFNREEWSK
jgi:hypothetical protein